MRPVRHNRSAAPRERGSAYIAVLGISMLVTTVGLGAMLAVRSQRRSADLRNDEAESRSAALGAADMAVLAIASDPAWRTRYANNAYTASRDLGRGKLAFKLVDESDGNLADDPLQPVRLYTSGRVGNAARVSSVLLTPTGPALDALNTAVYSAGGLTVNGTVYVAGGPAGTSGTTTVSLGATLNGDLETKNLVNLGSITGTSTVGGAARALPSTTIFDNYKARGTAIPYSGILSASISKKLISAASNPYGAANSSGVYFIDVPALNTLTISQSRLSATLVVNLGLSATLTISGPVAWDPPADGMPTLIVKGVGLGTLNINGSAVALSEADTGVNFNPVSTPYFGSSNAGTTDTFPGEVRGLIHIVGGSVSTNIGSNAIVRGCCLSDGSITLSGGAMLFADPALFANPPWGYITPTGIAVQAATWRREQDN